MGHDSRLLQLSKKDNVLIAIERIEEGEAIEVSSQIVIMKSTITLGHKVALRNISKDEIIKKYNAAIGLANTDIYVGDHVHVHNIRSDYTATHIIEK